MTTGRINQVAVLDRTAGAAQSRRVGAEAPQRARTWVLGWTGKRLLSKAPS